MTEATQAEWHPLGAFDEFSEDEPAARVAGQKPIAIFRIGDELFAMHDLCTHGHARLSEGYVEDGCVECPLHQGRFDIRNGQPTCDPVTEALRTYPVRIEGGRVFLRLD